LAPGPLSLIRWRGHRPNPVCASDRAVDVATGRDQAIAREQRLARLSGQALAVQRHGGSGGQRLGDRCHIGVLRPAQVRVRARPSLMGESRALVPIQRTQCRPFRGRPHQLMRHILHQRLRHIAEGVESRASHAHEAQLDRRAQPQAPRIPHAQLPPIARLEREEAA